MTTSEGGAVTKYLAGAKTLCRSCQLEGISTVATQVLHGAPMCDACARNVGAIVEHLEVTDKDLAEEAEREEQEEVLDTDQKMFERQDLEAAQAQNETKKENRMQGETNWQKIAVRRFKGNERVEDLAKELKVASSYVYVQTNKLKNKLGAEEEKPKKKSVRVVAPPTNGSVGAYTEAINSLKERYTELGELAERFTEEQERVGEIIEQLEETAGH